MKYHNHTVYTILNSGKKVSLIRLSGQWLERCGFKPGCNLPPEDSHLLKEYDEIW